MIKKYRKKPIVIEAIQRIEGNDDEVCDFLANSESCFGYDAGKITIETLEGEMTVSVGDYVIKGVGGECYPCKPDIFEQTYEEVSE